MTVADAVGMVCAVVKVGNAIIPEAFFNEQVGGKQNEMWNAAYHS